MTADSEVVEGEITNIEVKIDEAGESPTAKKRKLELGDETESEKKPKISPCRKFRPPQKKNELTATLQNMQKSNETLMREMMEAHKAESESSENRLLSFIADQNEKNRETLLEMTKIFAGGQFSSHAPSPGYSLPAAQLPNPPMRCSDPYNGCPKVVRLASFSPFSNAASSSSRTSTGDEDDDKYKAKHQKNSR